MTLRRSRRARLESDIADLSARLPTGICHANCRVAGRCRVPPPDGVRDTLSTCGYRGQRWSSRSWGCCSPSSAARNRSPAPRCPIPPRCRWPLAEDGYGIVAGFDDAPVQIEIFTEPQCTHCSDLQRDFGDQLAYYINVGRLADHLPAADLPRRRLRRLLVAGGQRAVPGRRGDRRTRRPPARSSSASSRTSGSTRIPAGPGSPTTRCATWRSAPGMPDPVADNIAGDEDSGRPRRHGGRPTSGTCSRSTR